MQCPQCQHDNAEGLSTCAGCGARLPVPEPEDAAGSYGGWDQVAETRQVYEAELIALRLREAGLEAQVVDQTFHQEPMPDVRNFTVVRVLVTAGRAEEARRLLAESVELPADVDPAGGED
jgi:hypothetical protein